MTKAAKKKVAVIGAGLQAGRRVPAIAEDPDYQVSWIVDRHADRAEKLIRQFGGQASLRWQDAVADPEVDVVVVLTAPDSHCEISMAASDAGKHVFCEKPLTRTEDEARLLVAHAQKTGRVLSCGFNHRFHPAIQEAFRLFREDKIGKPVFGRGRYGIAGRQGIEKEWRSNPKIVGGGQLMEQGIHLIDLFRWFLGDVAQVTGMTGTNHWPIAPLEDNGFALLKSKAGVIASIHSSLTQWINLFEFEIYGEKGSLTVHGLGASYGVEKLTVSLHDPSGPFTHHTTEYRGGDVSWKNEWKSFVAAMRGETHLGGDATDGLRAMEIARAVYSASQTGNTVTLG